ncbi:HNH endonuclease [Bacillus phage Spock]|uniref:HNH homing endonuclease n=1 Tax=Bacillus phage Spock TaxID=1406791 RepID=U5PXF2_9CAUD|nr:HNH endonuclease [Bacillus phage Spock]AGY48466.1 HNH homing endonuclease [Bacillus phage Spock]
MKKVISEKYGFEYPICPQCNERSRKFNYFSKKDGRPLFKKLCGTCSGSREKERAYAKLQREKGVVKYSSKYGDVGKRRITELTCDTCGFKAEHRCQLDVDHIDGNHDNNEQSNLQVLCSNCHRLKTWKNKDNRYLYSSRS